jgi:purine-binding chemotaxis protein CheW
MSNGIKNERLDLVVFRVENLMCAIPIMKIQEIIRPRKITQVHNCPSFIKGVINLRGKIVTILDLRERFHIPAASVEPSMRIVILNHDKEWIGLLVDDVDDTMTANGKDILPPPGNMAGIQEELFESVYQTENELIGILNSDRVCEAQGK